MIHLLVFNEIKYNWWIYSIAYLIALTFTALFFLAGKNIMILILVTLGIFHLVLIATGMRHTKEKRDRLVASLPVTIGNTAIARIIFVLFFQMCLLPIWIIFFLGHYSSMGGAVFWRLLSLNGFVFIYVLIFSINADLGHYLQSSRLRVRFWLYFLLVLLLCLMPEIIATYAEIMPMVWRSALFEFYQTFTHTGLSCLFIYTLAALMLFLSIRIFTARTSYTA
jgi:hypothetical protein